MNNKINEILNKYITRVNKLSIFDIGGMRTVLGGLQIFILDIYEPKNLRIAAVFLNELVKINRI